VLPAAFLAVPLFEVSLLDLGAPLAAFFANLMMFGWSVGLVISALVLRLGLGAESLAWVAVFAIAPLCGVYYPIETLPDWLQPVSWLLPPAYVFEGMRAVLFEQTVRIDLLLAALLMNLLYLAAAVIFFLHVCHLARQRGLFLTQGE
jgi:ABC-2 type transport system permease protein